MIVSMLKISRITASRYVLLAVIALAIIASLFTTYETINAERAERQQAIQTRRIISNLDNALSAAVDAETGQRGYLLTGNSHYLVPYVNGRRKLPLELEMLEQRLGSDPNPAVKPMIARMKKLSEEKLDDLLKTMDLYRERRINEAIASVQSNRGKVLMDDLRTAHRQMKEYERSKLNLAIQRTVDAENRLVPLLIVMVMIALGALALVIRLLIITSRTEVIAEQADLLAKARDQSDLLAKELNHRVKNAFAVILSLVRMTLRNEDDMEIATQKISDRILALSNAHAVTQGQGDVETLNLRELVKTALEPYRNDNLQMELTGPDIELPAAKATPLGMILHEMATNAVKYGAWLNTGGSLEIEWHYENGETKEKIVLTWVEHGGPSGAADNPEGFGSMMMRASAAQLNGSFERNGGPGGISATLVFPIT